jgi:hypothetical protein
MRPAPEPEPENSAMFAMAGQFLSYLVRGIGSSSRSA